MTISSVDVGEVSDFGSAFPQGEVISNQLWNGRTVSAIPSEFNNYVCVSPYQDMIKEMERKKAEKLKEYKPLPTYPQPKPRKVEVSPRIFPPEITTSIPTTKEGRVDITVSPGKFSVDVKQRF